MSIDLSGMVISLQYKTRIAVRYLYITISHKFPGHIKKNILTKKDINGSLPLCDEDKYSEQ